MASYWSMRPCTPLLAQTVRSQSKYCVTAKALVTAPALPIFCTIFVVIKHVHCTQNWSNFLRSFLRVRSFDISTVSSKPNWIFVALNSNPKTQRPSLQIDKTKAKSQSKVHATNPKEAGPKRERRIWRFGLRAVTKILWACSGPLLKSDLWQICLSLVSSRLK